MAAQVAGASQALITTIAVLYGIGILVANLHLAQLGFYEFGVLRSRYVAVGLAFALLASVPVGMGFAIGFQQYSAALQLRDFRNGVRFLLAGAAFGVFLAWIGVFWFIVIARPFLGDYASLGDLPNPFGPPSPSRVVTMAQSFMGWYVLAAVVGLALGVTTRDQRTRKWSDPASSTSRNEITNAFVTVIALANVVALFLPAVVLVVYATVVYPRLPVGFGGGAPIPVAIAPADGEADSLRALLEQDPATGAFDLLDENDRGFVFVIGGEADRRVAFVTRDAITGFRVLSPNATSK